MTDTRIITDSKTIRPGSLGPVTGDIWLALGQVAFPVEGWNDFVVVILEAWASALLRLLRSVSRSERVHFMDGPYEVEIVHASLEALELRAIEGGRNERARVIGQVLPLAESVLVGSNDVLIACREKGLWSVDADMLDALLPELRKAASNYSLRRLG